MNKTPSLSLLTTTIISINIMLGTGIFINTVNIARFAGALGFLTYALVAVLLVPLIIAIGTLLFRFPNGGFYTYSAKTLSPLLGFISAWAYFTGKLASAGLLVHVFSTFITTLLPALNAIPVLGLDLIIIALFSWLNTFNVTTNASIMYTFLFLKATPIATALLSCLYLFKHWSLPPSTFLWSGIPLGVPLVLYAFTGFEACCSLSNSIENPKVNGPRAVFTSFAIVVAITLAYQFLFFATLNTTLMAQTNFWGAFPALFASLLPNNPWLAHHAANMVHIAFAISALGGSYGILLSNHWNLFTLAEHGHTFFKPVFTWRNSHNMPVFCIVAESIICAVYLIFTNGNAVFLQQISVLGCTIAYTLSILGLVKSHYTTQRIKNYSIRTWVEVLALGSCCILLAACVRGLLVNGASSLVLFIGIVCAGFAMYTLTLKKQQLS